MREYKPKVVILFALLALALGIFGGLRLFQRGLTDVAIDARKVAEQGTPGNTSGRNPTAPTSVASTETAENSELSAAQAAPADLKESPEPKLPVIDSDACGSPNPKIYSGEPMPYKLRANDNLYSSWEESRALLRNLASGTEVTMVGAVNVIREPDRGVITGDVDESLRPLERGDEVLGYGLHSDGFISFWGKGILFEDYYEDIAFKGSCGFTDNSCHINITKQGNQEWWMQLRTNDGSTGWILGIKQNGDDISWGPNAGYACRD